MENQERTVMMGILSAVFIMVGIDIINDASEGVELWHVSIEAILGLVSLFGIFFLLRDSFTSKKVLRQTAADFSAYKKESEVWRAESRKYLEGLSTAIDDQLKKWELSPAEKEVAFLLLKGLSLKEIATARNTSEKTARVQSTAIYAKSGLSSRSELAAFFLEDLLVPHSRS